MKHIKTGTFSPCYPLHDMSKTPNTINYRRSAIAGMSSLEGVSLENHLTARGRAKIASIADIGTWSRKTSVVGLKTELTARSLFRQTTSTEANCSRQFIRLVVVFWLGVGLIWQVTAKTDRCEECRAGHLPDHSAELN